MNLTKTEIKFMHLVWENEPVSSNRLLGLCEHHFGWKKSTTYTFIKRLANKKALKNENTFISSLITKDYILKNTSEEVIKEEFQGSFLGFINAFLSDKKLSKAEILEIKNLIDKYEEKL